MASFLIIPKLLPLCILLSLLLALINWLLSLIQIKLPYTILKFFEVLLTLVIALTISITLIDYHIVINREQYSPMAYFPFALCLFAVQMYYAEQYYKISYVFITNFVTLLLTVILLYSLPSKIFTLPILLYYLVHTIVLLILSSKNHEDILALLKKQIWVNNSKLINSILPKKNINNYILSCVASFCYSSLNLCILVSFKEMGIAEYTALCLTCVILILTAIISFALLVKYDDAGNVAFPGCLLIHYIIESYKRCENLISGNVDLKPKFTLKSLFFAIILIINGLGSTAFAASIIPEEQPSSPIGEGQHLSRAAQATRQTMSWTASEMAQGASEIPRNTTSSIGSLGTGAVGAGLYSAVTNYLESGEEEATPEQELVALQEKLAQKDQRIAELEKALENQKNNSFFNRLFRCFRNNQSTT
uniref:hypothetical protein n=1 Tax=Ulva meridionalis TaxID=434723 RepID=UPI0021144674|nr:hypothetical protein NQY40_mgp47 [Ulva meridionalis]UTA96509.1 hypothetical protein [Ulva meridionalis]UTA96569.1 hypothetical protein [Ulva meridionalis]UTA96731.1 hypothetical protein [Ulva meridionalis]